MNNQVSNLANSSDGFAFSYSTAGFPSVELQPLEARNSNPFQSVSSEADFLKNQHESYPILNYINHILMEEDNVDEHPGMFHDPLALRATEKSLYEVLGQNCPPSPSPSDQPLPELHKIAHSPTSSTTSTGQLISTTSSSDIASTTSLETQSNNIVDPRNLSGIQYSSLLSDADALLQFKRGLEEGNKFLPTDHQLIIADLDQYALLSEQLVANSEEATRPEQSAFSSNEVELAETFEKILVFFENFEEPCPAIDFEHPSGSSKPGGWLQGSKGRKASAKKTVSTDSEALDVSALLTTCAQCVAVGDHKSANEQLKLIRQYSCSTGSAHQRLAIPFANALEARLAGVEPDFLGTMNFKLTSAAEELKAYRVYLCAPFRQIYAFFANKMILDAGSKAEKIHIVDFGIRHGFQWPSLIEQLSSRPGGPPKLRITGIEIPQPGFRPAERIQQTGRRLAKYCKRYNVPFEYQPIVIRNWHRIRLEELKLAENEWLAVNCQFRFGNLVEHEAGEEEEEEEDSKDAVLRLIRGMNPDICLTDVASAQLGGPFFLRRFREALYYFSTIFDLFEHNLPRQDKYRLKIEQELWGSEVMNVIACEGSARVERPETYKQWEVRYRHADLRLLPLNLQLVKELRNKVKEGYHNDFMFDEDGGWVLQGWKGRTIMAFSCWVPA